MIQLTTAQLLSDCCCSCTVTTGVQQAASVASASMRTLCCASSSSLSRQLLHSADCEMPNTAVTAVGSCARHHCCPQPLPALLCASCHAGPCMLLCPPPVAVLLLCQTAPVAHLRENLPLPRGPLLRPPSSCWYVALTRTALRLLAAAARTAERGGTHRQPGVSVKASLLQFACRQIVHP